MNNSSFERIGLLLVILSLLTVTACSTQQTPPPSLSLLPYPSTTHHPLFSIRGTKNRGNEVLINGRLVVPPDSSTLWSGEVLLSEGANILTIISFNDLGVQSLPAVAAVTLNTTPPSAPGIIVPSTSVSSWSQTFALQGTKDANTDILINGKELIPFSPSTAWSYTYTPAQGTTLLQVTSRNELGNESSKTAITLGFTGLPAPWLISPLDGESVKQISGIFNQVLFSWNGVGYTQNYKIQIAASPDFSSLIFEASGIGNPYSWDPSLLTSPLSRGIYYWRIGSFDASGNLFYSPSRRFLFGKIKGDFNGDGYADILVGAELAGGSGQVRVFFGGPNPQNGTMTPESPPGLTLQGENPGDLFGTALASGDLNGDGYDDIIVGAYQNSAGGKSAGRVYIYFGGPTLHSSPDVILTGFSPGEQFGVSVASGADINRDGYDDLLIGANFNSVNGTFAGRAYLFLGGKTISFYPGMVFSGEAPNDRFGISVAMGGDMNGDGFSDFLIGAGGDGTTTHIGKAYLYYGEYEPGNQSQFVLTGSASPGDGFGHFVTGIGDINGDGYDDFLIGAPYHAGRNGETLEGVANLYYGGPDLTGDPNLILWGSAASGEFGYSAASLGDIPNPTTGGLPKKDGYADFIVGAYGGSPSLGSLYAGWADLFKGNSNPTQGNMHNNRLISGNTGSSESFSQSISSPGDFNGDGVNDLIVGAFHADQSKGRAYYFDGLSLSNSAASTPCATCTLFGLSPYEGFGFSVY